MTYFLTFIGGIIVGLVCATVFFIAAFIDRISNPADNVTSTLKRLAHRMVDEKGAILFPKTDDMIAMEETFERNDREGKDTPIGEIEGDE